MEVPIKPIAAGKNSLNVLIHIHIRYIIDSNDTRSEDHTNGMWFYKSIFGEAKVTPKTNMRKCAKILQNIISTMHGFRNEVVAGLFGDKVLTNYNNGNKRNWLLKI